MELLELWTLTTSLKSMRIRSQRQMNTYLVNKIIKAERAKRARLSVAKNIDNRMYVGAYAWPYAWPNLRETFRSCWGMVGE